VQDGEFLPLPALVPDCQAHSMVTILTELLCLLCLRLRIRISDLYLISRLRLKWLVRSWNLIRTEPL